MEAVKTMELPYERIAMAGGEMPGEMEYPDQILFLQLRILYDSHKKGIIDREAAKSEKSQLLREYEANKIAENFLKQVTKQIKATELARSAYRKEKTIENADRILACIEGAI